MNGLEKLSTNIGVAAATTLFLLGITEAVLTMYAFLPAADKHECIRHSKAGNFFQISGNPHLGVELKPNAKAARDLAGYSMSEVNINSAGQRENRLYSVEKPLNVYRIAAIGDSVTFGWNVPASESWPKVLEKSLGAMTGGKPIVEVINFGVPGYNGIQKLAALKESLRYNPDLVVVGWLIDDSYSSSTQLFAPSQYVAKFLNKHFYVYSCVRELVAKKSLEFQAPYKKQYEEGGEGRTESEKLFGEIANTSRETKTPILIALLPVWQTFEKNSADGIPAIHEFLKKTARSKDLPTLDILPAIEELILSRYTINEDDIYHPNSNGHELIAKLIMDEIAKERLLGAVR